MSLGRGRAATSVVAMTSEPTDRVPTDRSATAGGTDRRRFLRTAGAAAGVAWAAPTVLSATPAAAGLPSPDPCAPVITRNTSTCVPPPGFAEYRIEVPPGCPGVPIEFAYSNGGGPFVVSDCTTTTLAGIGFGNLSTSRQARLRWLDACPGGNLIQEFLSPVYGPCGPPPGAPVDGASAPATVTITLGDGSTRTSTLP